jgi:hypothetical protein
MPSRNPDDETPKRSPNPAVRQIVVMTLGLACAVAFYFIVGRSLTNPIDILLPQLGTGSTLLEDDSFIAQRTHIEPLNGVEQRRLNEQRALAQKTARRHIGTALSAGQSTRDIRVIQEIIDKRVFSNEDTYELQALGVALGDVMAAQLDLRWVAVNDDVGRSRALQWGDGEDLIFPVTMLSKRVEVDLGFRVQVLYDKVVDTVNGFEMRSGGSRRRAGKLPKRPRHTEDGSL